MTGLRSASSAKRNSVFLNMSDDSLLPALFSSAPVFDQVQQEWIEQLIATRTAATQDSWVSTSSEAVSTLGIQSSSTATSSMPGSVGE